MNTGILIMNTGILLLKTGFNKKQSTKTNCKMEFSLSSPAGGELEIIRNVEDKALPYKLPASKTDMVNGNL
jgi:hypothetical protein